MTYVSYNHLLMEMGPAQREFSMFSMNLTKSVVKGNSQEHSTNENGKLVCNEAWEQKLLGEWYS